MSGPGEPYPKGSITIVLESCQSDANQGKRRFQRDANEEKKEFFADLCKRPSTQVIDLDA